MMYIYCTSYGAYQSNPNYCTTVIAFLIYKYWLFTINNNVKKNARRMYVFIESELNYRIKVLKINNNQTELESLSKIKNELKMYTSRHYDPG